MRLTRRDFLKLVATAPMILATAKEALALRIQLKTEPSRGEYAILYVPDKCIWCKACQVACKSWNELSAESTRLYYSFQNPPDLSSTTWTVVKYSEGRSRLFMLKFQCMHCSEAPCSAICPAHAITRTKEGAVVINTDLCIGCGYCAEACPFGVPRYDQIRNRTYKCTMCIDRIRRGLKPACVTAYITGALDFVPVERIREIASRYKYRYVDGIPSPYVGYTHVIYASNVVNFESEFKLPPRPEKPLAYAIRTFTRPLAVVLSVLAAIAAFAHYLGWRRKLKRSSER